MQWVAEFPSEIVPANTYQAVTTTNGDGVPVHWIVFLRIPPNKEWVRVGSVEIPYGVSEREARELLAAQYPAYAAVLPKP